MSDVTMPQLGETVTEGTITKWFKQVGDRVAEDEVLFEVSTDKVDSEVPSPAGGYVTEILVPEGETVDVGTRLAVISTEPPAAGGGDGQAAPPPAEAPATATEAAPEPPAPAAEAPAPAAEAPAAEEPEPQPAPAEGESRPAAAEAEVQAARAGEAGAETQPAEVQAARAAPAPTEAADEGEAAGRVLSPVVRRLLKEHDLDPALIQGTGQGGRITRSDVLAFIDRGGRQATPAAPAAPAAAPAPARAAPTAPAREAPAPAPAAVAAVTPGQDDERIPFTNIRRRTAEHMVRSKATSAHVLTATEVDFENVERVRQAAKEEFRAREGFSLTYLPFIARATIDALAEFPHLNASVGDDELVVHRRIHLGIAVDLSFEGLIVPVVRDAQDKRMRAIAREISDLAARARTKKLGADEIAGGTFTITNPGPFGTFITAPVINQPQVAILSTDGVKKRAVVVELPDGSDAIVVHPVGMLALTFDHRANDGAYCSAFLAKCKEILETRDWSEEL